MNRKMYYIRANISRGERDEIKLFMTKDAAWEWMRDNTDLTLKEIEKEIHIAVSLEGVFTIPPRP